MLDLTTGATTAITLTDTQTNDFAGTWAVDDTFYLTRAHYVWHNNDLALDAITPHCFQLSNPSINLVIGGATDGFPSWRIADRVPPVSYGATAVSAYQPANAHRICAYAQYAATAIGRYEIQYRDVPDGSWTPVTSGGCSAMTNVTASCTSWANSPVMDFWVRAIDVMGNAEAWPEDRAHWARIYIYAMRVGGSVRDSAGVGLPGVIVQVPNSLEGPQITDGEGRYAFRLTTTDPFTVTATLAGDSATRAARDRDRDAAGYVTLDFTLKPAAIALVNGGFEAGLASWTPSGPFGAAITIHDSLDGAQALVLGGTDYPGAGALPLAERFAGEGRKASADDVYRDLVTQTGTLRRASRCCRSGTACGPR